MMPSRETLPPAGPDDDVILPIRDLETLLCKARSAGWELGRGLCDEQRVDTYLSSVVGEIVGTDVARAMGWLG